MTVSILLVDDESDVADLFRQRFRREVQQGTYAMHFADSGEDALGKLAGGVEPTLIAVLSDINMPGMDGLDLLGEIKRRYPELPAMMWMSPIWNAERPVNIAARRICGASWRARGGVVGKVWKCNGNCTWSTACQNGSQLGCHIGSMPTSRRVQEPDQCRAKSNPRPAT